MLPKPIASHNNPQYSQLIQQLRWQNLDWRQSSSFLPGREDWALHENRLSRLQQSSWEPRQSKYLRGWTFDESNITFSFTSTAMPGIIPMKVDQKRWHEQEEEIRHGVDEFCNMGRESVVFLTPVNGAWSSVKVTPHFLLIAELVIDHPVKPFLLVSLFRLQCCLSHFVHFPYFCPCY